MEALSSFGICFKSNTLIATISLLFDLPMVILIYSNFVFIDKYLFFYQGRNKRKEVQVPIYYAHSIRNAPYSLWLGFVLWFSEGINLK